MKLHIIEENMEWSWCKRCDDYQPDRFFANPYNQHCLFHKPRTRKKRKTLKPKPKLKKICKKILVTPKPARQPRKRKRKFNVKHRTRRLSVLLYPKLEPCQLCKSNLHVQRHHLDYLNPLNIMFLCLPCHIKQHSGHAKRILERQLASKINLDTHPVDE